MSADLDAVREAVRALVGGPCGPLTLLAMGGSTSATYAAEAAGRPVIVKTSATTALDRAVHNLAVLRGLGLPVPEVLGYDDSRARTPLAVLVMTALPGRDLRHELADMDRAAMSVLAGQVIEAERAAATLPPNTGCGFVGIGEPATRTWSDVVRHPDAGPPPPAPGPAVAELQESLAAVLDGFEPYFTTVRPTCFLDDLTTKNVMVQDGRLTGFVDFDVVCYGDPLFHLGLTAAAVTADLPPRCAFYVEQLRRISGCDARQRLVVGLYEAVHLVNFAASKARPPADLVSAASRALSVVAATRHEIA